MTTEEKIKLKLSCYKKEKIKLKLFYYKIVFLNLLYFCLQMIVCIFQSLSNVNFKEYCVNETCKTLAKKQRDNFNKRFNQCQKKSV